MGSYSAALLVVSSVSSRGSDRVVVRRLLLVQEVTVSVPVSPEASFHRLMHHARPSLDSPDQSL